MRYFLTILSFAFFSFAAQAQEVHGKITDASGKAIPGATVSLLRDTVVLKLTATTNDGSFQFVNISNGTYRVKTSAVGFQPTASAAFEVSGAGYTVAPIQLSPLSKEMAALVVTATRPVVEVKADKTILNVEGTVNAMGTDALELLRKSPGVQVDKDDNLSVNGKNGVQIYIDGRPTPMSGSDLSSYLKTIQSNQIDAIEIITNPSAKYEAAGNAGIINIRLKKNKSFGTNGTVNAGYNIGTYPKYTAGMNINHRNQTMNVFANYTYNNSKNLNSISLKRNVLDSFFDQTGEMVMKQVSHNFKAGADFFLNKQSTLGLMVNGTFAQPDIANRPTTFIYYKPTMTVSRILKADNVNQMKRNNVNGNLNYTYTGKDGRSLVINADHGIYKNNNDQFQPNYYYDASGQNLISSVIYHMVAPTDIRISSLKADYEQNWMKGKLGIGGKLSLVSSDNDFRRYNVISNADQLDRERSNRFKYDEQINAGYVNYNRAFKGFMIQAGLRVENTDAKGRSTGEQKAGASYVGYDSTFKRNYTDLFPSAAITFNKNPMSQVSISYSRRIDRPAYQDLNPFEFKLDEYTFQKGNINLRPQYTNSFGITHTYKFKLNTTLNYSHVKDMFVTLPDTIEKTKGFISKRNLAEQDIVSLNVSYPFMYKSYMIFTNLSSNYSRYRANLGPGRDVNLNAFGANVYMQHSLKFKKTWTAELSGFYNTPTIHQGVFRSKGMGTVDAGLSKTIWNNKATIKASVSDIFHTLRFTGYSDFAGQRTDVLARWESRQFKINFIYRFGSNSVKAARTRGTASEEESKRASQAGGGLGIGQ